MHLAIDLITSVSLQPRGTLITAVREIFYIFKSNELIKKKLKTGHYCQFRVV